MKKKYFGYKHLLNLCGRQKLRVAIYARKSAEDARQTSLDLQISECKTAIAKYPELFELTATYQEDNVSGMFDDRNEYQKLLKEIQNKTYDVIVALRLDRLNRNVYNELTLEKIIRQYGLYIYAGDDVVNPSSSIGELFRLIKLAINQFESRKDADMVMQQECKNAKEGKSAGGVPPYGLKCVNQIYMIDDNEAPAIRVMFEKAAQGFSYKKIIDEVEKLGYRTRSGGKFKKSTLNSILHNDKYYGMYIYNRIGGKKKAKRVLIDFHDEIRNETAIPPIISKKLFDEVQDILENRRTGSKLESGYFLTGYIYCKACSSKMSGAHVSARGGRKIRTYACPKHTSASGSICSTKRINAEYIESIVKSSITDIINACLADKEQAPRNC